MKKYRVSGNAKNIRTRVLAAIMMVGMTIPVIRHMLWQIGRSFCQKLINDNNTLVEKVGRKADAKYVRLQKAHEGTYIAYKAVLLQFDCSGRMKEIVSNVRFHLGNYCLLGKHPGLTMADVFNVRVVTLKGCSKEFVKNWFNSAEKQGVIVDKKRLYAVGQMKNNSKEWNCILVPFYMREAFLSFAADKADITVDAYRSSYCLNEIGAELPPMTKENTLVVDIERIEKILSLVMDPKNAKMWISKIKKKIDHADGLCFFFSKEKKFWYSDGLFTRQYGLKANTVVIRDTLMNFLRAGMEYRNSKAKIPTFVKNVWGDQIATRKIEFVVLASAAKLAKNFKKTELWFEAMEKAAGDTCLHVKPKQQRAGSCSSQIMLGMNASQQEVRKIVHELKTKVREKAHTSSAFGQYSEMLEANRNAATLRTFGEEFAKTMNYFLLNIAAGQMVLPYTRTLILAVDPWAVITAALGMKPLLVIPDECSYSRCMRVGLGVLTRNPGKISDITPTRFVWLPKMMSRMLPENVLFCSWESAVMTDRLEADCDTDMIGIWGEGCPMWDLIWRNAVRQYSMLPVRRHLVATKAKPEWSSFGQMVAEVAANDGTGRAGNLNFYLQSTADNTDEWYEKFLWATGLFNCFVDPLGIKAEINETIVQKAPYGWKNFLVKRYGKNGRKALDALYNVKKNPDLYKGGVPQLDTELLDRRFRSKKDVESGGNWLEMVAYAMKSWYEYDCEDAKRVASSPISIQEMLIRGEQSYSSQMRFDVTSMMSDSDIETWNYKYGSPRSATWKQMLKVLSNDTADDQWIAKMECLHNDMWAEAEGDADRDYADASLREAIAEVCAARKARRQAFLKDAFGENWSAERFYNTSVFYGLGGSIDRYTGKGERLMGKLTRACYKGTNDPVEFAIDFLAKDFKEQMLRALRESAVKQELQPIAAAPEASDDEISSDDWSAYVDAEYDD